jgi:hypothetical protein
MSDGDLAAVLGDLITLLDSGGHPDRATWLRERLMRLSDEIEPAEVEHVREELHGVVLGIVGLYDLTLTPDESAHRQEGREMRLDELAGRLYRLPNPLLDEDALRFRWWTTRTCRNGNSDLSPRTLK